MDLRRLFQDVLANTFGSLISAVIISTVGIVLTWLLNIPPYLYPTIVIWVIAGALFLVFCFVAIAQHLGWLTADPHRASNRIQQSWVDSQGIQNRPVGWLTIVILVLVISVLGVFVLYQQRELSTFRPKIANICFHDPVNVLRQTYVDFPSDVPQEMRFGKAALIELNTPEEFEGPSYISIHTKYPSSIMWTKLGKETKGESLTPIRDQADFLISSMMGPNRITRMYLVGNAPFEVLCADRIPEDALGPTWRERLHNTK